MSLDQVIRFWEILGDQVKGRSPKKLKTLISLRVSLCSAAEMTGFKLQYDSSHLRSVFVDQVIHFGENLGDPVKGRSPKMP